MNLSREQVESIPKLIADGQTQVNIALCFGVSRNCINRWVRILKKRGVDIKVTMGKPSLFRKESPCPQAQN